jgi:phospholipase C
MNGLHRCARALSAPVATLLLVAGLSGADARPSRPLAGPLAARAAGTVFAPPSLALPLPAPDAKGKIKHVVIIMQENRSFDNLFQGYSGADTQSYGYDSSGNKITLKPVPFEASYDINHDIYSFLAACNGTGSIPGTNCQMNGFNNEGNGCSHCTDPEYGYVPSSETTTYFNMASQYVLADRMFTSHIDDSFISHQYIIAAQADGAAYFPSGSWGCEGGPSDTIASLSQSRQVGSPRKQVCWDINTLADELVSAHKSWRFYASNINSDGGLWSAYQAINHIYYGSGWSNVISPQSRVLTDIASGKLASVTWVTPTFANSDHSGIGTKLGPSWVASVVNTIGQSKFWKSTAIFIMWDEWGGWYDHVPPPYVDYDGLGMRVPLLIISPYAKVGYVSHVQYEHGSILRFAEDQFGLGRLSAADARANSPATDAFDFSSPPRTFTPFSSQRSATYFIKEPLDRRVPFSE